MIEELQETLEDFAGQLALMRRQLDRLGRGEILRIDPSPFQALPGLRGLWTMGAFDSTGIAQDSSGHAHDLSKNGTSPTYGYDANFYAPYLDLPGTDEYLSLADTGDIDILGNEAIIVSAARGLTLGGWFYTSDVTPAADSMLITKYSASAGNYSYRLFLQTDGTVQAEVSSDGSALTTVTSTAIASNDSWFFAAMKYTPSTSLDVFLNMKKATNTTSIPASIYNGNANLEIGARGGGGLLFTGRVSLCFLCATALNDAVIGELFQASRGGYGV